MSELKPCPFCGKAPQVSSYYIECTCDAEPKVEFMYYKERQFCIDAWNTRALDERVAAMEDDNTIANICKRVVHAEDEAKILDKKLTDLQREYQRKCDQLSALETTRAPSPQSVDDDVLILLKAIEQKHFKCEIGPDCPAVIMAWWYEAGKRFRSGEILALLNGGEGE